MSEAATLDHLDLNVAIGLYRITSAGPTMYYLDLDSKPHLCMRSPRPGTRSRGLTDGMWAPLLRVRSLAADGSGTAGFVRVGERPYWELNAGDQIVWWIQRQVTAITPVTEDEQLSVDPVESGPEITT